MIHVTCPSCNRQFTVEDFCAGRTQKCLKCGAIVEIPSSAASLGDTRPVPAAGGGRRAFPPGPDTDERGEIPLADDVADATTKASPRPAPPTANGLVMMPIQDILLVDFQHARVLDAQVIEAIGRDLYALVDQQARKKLILDFSKVEFLSSQMLGVIMTLHKKSAAIKGRVVLCGLRPELKKVFALMKIDKLVPIVEMEGEAMEALGFRAGS
jgi:anti-sigma B factor antagonist